MNQIRTKTLILIPLILFFIFYFSIQPLSTVYHLNLLKQDNSNTQVRIHCLILTSPKYFDTRARAVNLTWAPRCDRYFFIAKYSNDTKGLPIAPIGNLSEAYSRLTIKTTSATIEQVIRYAH